jgi:hypothetical protein
VSRRLILAILAFGLTAGAAWAADPDPNLARLTAQAEDCVRAAIPSVERADPSLASGADLILDDLCAAEIAKLGRYQQGLRMLEIYRNQGTSDDPDAYGEELKPAQRAKAAKAQAQFTDMVAKAHVDPETGQIVFPPDAPASLNQMSTVLLVSTGTPAWPELRALTGRLLLEARLARKP